MLSYKKAAIKAAKKASKILLKYFGNIKKIEYKTSQHDFVTVADKESEKKIIEIIQKQFPDHNFLGEESGDHDAKSDFCWIIDPLDGTTNFSHAYPYFCISIALQKNKETILGVIYNPISKELFVAEKGKGAFLNGKRIHTSDKTELIRCLMSTGFWYDRGKIMDFNMQNMRNVMKAVQGVRRAGSAALDLAYLACGRLDGHWEFNLKPWDTAAGALMIQEAGGKITNDKGKDWNPFDKFMLATNGKIHELLKKVINANFEE
ncbi:MAG: inositol monophosphatase [Candidatus Diapherotrites archaeon CG08_land_8_20_14_0_20_34_12]|nr:MAG: inositol monophosphatase [Candidatus Diapherotrites archaeon CG08_land_8_20_14_0_20_34_12]